jgi:hypothetical protein
MHPLLTLGLLFALSGNRSSATSSEFSRPALPSYFSSYCEKCHDAKVQKGDFRIDTLSSRVGFENTPQWLEILDRITSGEMPPPREKVRPPAAESAQIIEWISTRMKEGEAARLAARGRVSFNRLSRDEYVNTVRDLLGVHFDATDPVGLMEDEEWHGFERLGSVLNLSAASLEKYLKAAEIVLAEAYPASAPKPLDATHRAVTEKSVRQPYRDQLAARGLLEKLRFEMWPGDSFTGSSREDLPAPGIYEISYTLSGLKPADGPPPRIKVIENKLGRVLYESDIVAPEDKPIAITFRAHLPKGRPDIQVFNAARGAITRPLAGRHGGKPFVSIAEGRIPWQLKLTDEAGQPRYPFLILDSFSWKGPIQTDDEITRRNEYWPDKENDWDKVRAGFQRLARRAFRRPVSPVELEDFVQIARREAAAGETFRDAVKTGMQAILCSKSFLFLSEGDEKSARIQLTDWEIASRLSYLLWSTMPDDTLLNLAEAGRLRDPAERARQLARMLEDPRAARFSNSFSRQWLHLRHVGRFPPDKKLYPEYDGPLEQSMVAETQAFFHEVLRGGLTLREFLNSDWGMLNHRLADFYGLRVDAGEDDTLRRVTLPVDSRRGGLLTQAAILSLTSDGTRHRPVHRGVWLSEVILGKVPPPPPANVDPIATNPVDSPKATLRMKLEAHIHDPRCASCHARIDPLGLAFENYDAIGRWRTQERTEGAGEDPAVNPAGTLPDGRTYQTPEEFKKLLLADIDTFQSAFLEKLATYGLRRSMTYDDREALRAVAAAGRERNYRLRDLLEAFVCSPLFQSR